MLEGFVSNLASAVDALTGGIRIIQKWAYAHIAAAGTTTVKAAPGVLGSVVVNKAGDAAATVTVYDNTAGSGTVVAVIDASAKGAYAFNAALATGLTVVVASTTAPDVTVTYA